MYISRFRNFYASPIEMRFKRKCSQLKLSIHNFKYFSQTICNSFENLLKFVFFQNILFSIGNAFLYYVNHFKLYSSFCASHSKAQKVLHPSKLPNRSFLNLPFHRIPRILFTDEGNQALQEFLAARNPKQQHSSTLESYLIKPIQRILKYPLLLQQLRNLTDPNTDEHQHLLGNFLCHIFSF